MTSTDTFDPAPWVDRPCEYRHNTMFHDHPDLPCSRHCFCDIWHTFQVGLMDNTCERDEAEDKAKWDRKDKLITAKRAEYKRRVDACVNLVNQRWRLDQLFKSR